MDYEWSNKLHRVWDYGNVHLILYSIWWCLLSNYQKMTSLWNFIYRRLIMLELGDCGLSLWATEVIFMFSKLLNDKSSTRRFLQDIFFPVIFHATYMFRCTSTEFLQSVVLYLIGNVIITEKENQKKREEHWIC